MHEFARFHSSLLVIVLLFYSFFWIALILPVISAMILLLLSPCILTHFLYATCILSTISVYSRYCAASWPFDPYIPSHTHPFRHFNPILLSTTKKFDKPLSQLLGYCPSFIFVVCWTLFWELEWSFLVGIFWYLSQFSFTSGIRIHYGLI